LTTIKGFAATQRQKILQLLLDQLQQGDRGLEFTLTCARVISELVSVGTIDVGIVDGALPVIRKHLESKDPDILSAWSDVMITTIGFMSLPLIESEVRN
jgi:hypothetical protein